MVYYTRIRILIDGIEIKIKQSFKGMQYNLGDMTMTLNCWCVVTEVA